MDIAFAVPIPLNLQSSFTLNFDNSARLLSTELSMRFDSSTADSSRLPEAINMAINSALLNWPLPFNNSFSRGRSSSAQLLIGSFSFMVIRVRP